MAGVASGGGEVKVEAGYLQDWLACREGTPASEGIGNYENIHN